MGDDTESDRCPVRDASLLRERRISDGKIAQYLWGKRSL